MTKKKQALHIGGMTCVNCQNRIEEKMKKLSGIDSVSVDYVSGMAIVIYDESEITINEINATIESQGYTTSEIKESSKTALEIVGVLVIILALSFLLRMFSVSSIAASFPLVEAGMGYGMMLIIGLLTSVHCIAMCGGINLSQALRKGDVVENTSCKGGFNFSLLLPSFLYNGGRLISYTVVGVAVGALGSIVSFSNQFRNIIFLLAGLFMVIMGINILGLFPALRRFSSLLPQFLAKRIDRQKDGKDPLIVGILNGFMPCGPLQAMQLYALSTGSPVAGGISMFLFCLGTTPLMFTLGAAGGILSSVKGRAFSQKAMQAGAILVAAMGVVMFNNGLDSAGFANPLVRAAAFVNPVSPQTEGGAFMPMTESGVQIIHSTLLPNRYPAITVQQGIPVRWIINAPPGSINSCNNRITIREYGIQHIFRQGENIIEFMPEKTGRFHYACWMSMIRSTITVIAQGEILAAETEPDITPRPAGVVIPTDGIAIAQMEGNYQSVEINLTKNGFQPAIVVVQQRLPVLWSINVDSVGPGGSLMFPAFYTELEMEQGVNTVQFIAIEDFDFSTADNNFYGYVKTVADLNRLDLEAIKAEVAGHETLIYPAAHFE